MKRAHHRALAAARKWLEPFDITPARFDFLYAVFQHAHLGGIFQTDMIAALGCVKSNVTRLRDALIELGYVYTSFDGSEERDGILIKLTNEGYDLVKRILASTREHVEEKSEEIALAPPAPENETPKEGLVRVMRAVRTKLSDKCVFDIYDNNICTRLRETLIFVRKKNPVEMPSYYPKQNIFNGCWRRAP